MIKVSIIIVGYNAREYLQQCLASIFRARQEPAIEVILVDNASTDGSVAMVRELFPQVHIVENTNNTGFAAGNNLGIKRARGEFCLLLNSDTEITGSALRTLVSFLDEHPDAGVVSGRIVYADRSDQGVARRFPTPMNALFGRKTFLTRIFPNNRFARRYMICRAHSSSEPFEVDWVSGCCLMIRSSVIEQVGVLDEKFFMYWEDADWCFRIKQKGWKVFCVPEAVVVHHEGKSSRSRMSNRLIMEFNKSVYRYYRKHCVRSRFDVMNIVAIIGLSVRTLVLITANFFRGKVKMRRRGLEVTRVR
jgi:GT2 family glycosyltransferase